MENRENKRVPDVTFRTRENGQWRDITSEELFGGRRVVVFSLPGAFTPTCSASHLPRYEELAHAFREAGVDEIVCVSVNDGFVMEAWGREQNAQSVRLLPDGNGDFTRGMGMLVDKSDLGFGPRSWRYSMLVDDGIIKKMFVERDVPGDPYEVSDADTMLSYVAPSKARADVVIFTKSGCPHCARAKKLLASEGIDYNEVEIQTMGGIGGLRAVSGATTAPQVFIGGKRIGGADDLARYIDEKKAAGEEACAIGPQDHAA
jgi:glutathione-dependent peroxiredoxin